jgi:hypothetical protein
LIHRDAAHLQFRALLRELIRFGHGLERRVLIERGLTA